MGQYTSTYDASHKVSGGGGHVKGFVRHIGREADEQAGFHFKHANPNIDPSRTCLNGTMVNDGQGGFRPLVSVDGRPPSDELERYLNVRLATVTKTLRKDAVLMRPMVFQLDPKWFVEHNPDWRQNGLNDEARGYVAEQLGFAADEFGQANIVGYSLHMDEAQPQLQVLFTPVTNDGRLSQKDFFKGPADFKRQHSALHDRLQAAGYDSDRKVSARSKEHLSSSEFQARADRIAAKLDHLEKVESGYQLMLDAVGTREADLDQRTRELDDRESTLAAREHAVARKSTQASAATFAADQKLAQAAATQDMAAKALGSARRAERAAQARSQVADERAVAAEVATRRAQAAESQAESAGALARLVAAEYRTGKERVAAADASVHALFDELKAAKVRMGPAVKAGLTGRAHALQMLREWDEESQPQESQYGGRG